jgi:hypothetical protein
MIPGPTRAMPVTLVALALLAGCSATPIGDPYVVPLDELRAGMDGAQRGAVVLWIDPGERLSLTTFGSSGCPTAPTGVRVDDDTLRISTVLTGQSGGAACSADLSPTSYALDLPDELRGQTGVDVVVELPEGDVAQKLEG